MLWCVGEGRAVLRGRVLRPMRSNVAQDHHDGAVRVHSLRHTEVGDAVVGNDVCQVVLWREQTLSTMQSVSDRKSRCQSLWYCAGSVPLYIPVITHIRVIPYKIDWFWKFPPDPLRFSRFFLYNNFSIFNEEMQNFIFVLWTFSELQALKVHGGALKLRTPSLHM